MKPHPWILALGIIAAFSACQKKEEVVPTDTIPYTVPTTTNESNTTVITPAIPDPAMETTPPLPPPMPPAEISTAETPMELPVTPEMEPAPLTPEIPLPSDAPPLE